MHIIPATYTIVKSTRSVISNTSIILFLIMSASIYSLCRNLLQVLDDLLHPGLRLDSALCVLLVVMNTRSCASTNIFQLSNQAKMHAKLADGFLLKSAFALYLHKLCLLFSVPALNIALISLILSLHPGFSVSKCG